MTFPIEIMNTSYLFRCAAKYIFHVGEILWHSLKVYGLASISFNTNELCRVVCRLILLMTIFS